MRRSASLVLLLTIVASLSITVGQASAYDPQYYDDPSYATALTALALGSGSSYAGASLEAGVNPGGAYAGSSQAGAIRKGLMAARVAAGTLPPIQVTLGGTLVLGVGALALGVQIGRGIDTKFLGGNGFLGQTWGDSYIAGTRWSFNGVGAQGAFADALDVPVGTPYWTLTPTNAAALNNPNTGWYFTCPGGWSWNSCQQWSGYQQEANDSWLSALDSTTTGVPTARRVDNFYCNAPNTPARSCSGLFLVPDDMRQLVQWHTFRDSQVTDDPVHVVPSWNPSYAARGFGSQAAQNEAFANALTNDPSDSLREFVDHALNPTGTVPNPLIDFEMPSCYGLAVSDCQNAIADAADEVDKTVSFSVITAPAEDTDVARNLVLSTFPAAGSLVRPETVTLTKNTSTAPQKTCKTETDNPHPSEHNPTMQTSGRVKCNYTGEASYQMWMWECSSTQTSAPGDLYGDVLGGAFGCALRETTSGAVAVVAMPLAQSGGSAIRCPNILEQSQPYVDWGAGFWIGASVTTNPSPAFNHLPSVSAPGIQYDDPGW